MPYTILEQALIDADLNSVKDLISENPCSLITDSDFQALTFVLLHTPETNTEESNKKEELINFLDANLGSEFKRQQNTINSLLFKTITEEQLISFKYLLSLKLPPVVLTSLFEEALQQGKINIISYLLILDATLLQYINTKKANALMIAAAYGQNATIDFLLSRDPDLIHQLAPNAINVLMVAASSGKNDTIDHLLKIKPHLIAELNSKGYNVLMVAALSGHNATIDHLLKIDNTLLHHIGIDGYDILMLAASKGENDTIDHLLTHDPKLLHYVSRHGWNILIAAVLQEQHATIDHLLKLKPKLLYHTVDNGWNILMMAAIFGKNNTIDHLLKIEPNLLNHLNKSKQNVLMAAASTGKCDTIDHLLKIDSRLLHHYCNDNWNILMIAAISGQNATIDHLLKTDSNLINHLSSRKWNILMIAAAHGRNHTIDHLLKIEPKLLHHLAMDQSNVLAIAAASGQIATIEHLLNIDQTLLFRLDAFDMKPLVAAQAANQIETVKYFSQKYPQLIVENLLKTSRTQSINTHKAKDKKTKDNSIPINNNRTKSYAHTLTSESNSGFASMMQFEKWLSKNKLQQQKENGVLKDLINNKILVACQNAPNQLKLSLKHCCPADYKAFAERGAFTVTIETLLKLLTQWETTPPATFELAFIELIDASQEYIKFKKSILSDMKITLLKLRNWPDTTLNISAESIKTAYNNFFNTLQDCKALAQACKAANNSEKNNRKYSSKIVAIDECLMKTLHSPLECYDILDKLTTFKENFIAQINEQLDSIDSINVNPQATKAMIQDLQDSCTQFLSDMSTFQNEGLAYKKNIESQIAVWKISTERYQEDARTYRIQLEHNKKHNIRQAQIKAELSDLMRDAIALRTAAEQQISAREEQAAALKQIDDIIARYKQASFTNSCKETTEETANTSASVVAKNPISIKHRKIFMPLLDTYQHKGQKNNSWQNTRSKLSHNLSYLTQALEARDNTIELRKSLRNIINYNDSNHVVLKTHALLFAVASLMETLKNLHGNELLPLTLVRKCRDTIYHAHSLALFSQENSAALVQNLAFHTLQYLDKPNPEQLRNLYTQSLFVQLLKNELVLTRVDMQKTVETSLEDLQSYYEIYHAFKSKLFKANQGLQAASAVLFNDIFLKACEYSIARISAALNWLAYHDKENYNNQINNLRNKKNTATQLSSDTIKIYSNLSNLKVNLFQSYSIRTMGNALRHNNMPKKTIATQLTSNPTSTLDSDLSTGMQPSRIVAKNGIEFTILDSSSSSSSYASKAYNYRIVPMHKEKLLHEEAIDYTTDNNLQLAINEEDKLNIQILLNQKMRCIF